MKKCASDNHRALDIGEDEGNCGEIGGNFSRTFILVGGMKVVAFEE